MSAEFALTAPIEQDPEAQVRDRIDAAVLSHITYRDGPESDPRAVSITGAAWVDFLHPIRRPMAYQGQWCKPGYYYMAAVDDLVSYESRYEMAQLIVLEQGQAVVAICAQPFRLHWRDQGRGRTHVPDFFVRYRDGSAEVIDVKGSRVAARPENALVFGVTGRACKAMGHEFRVAIEVSKVQLKNLRWLEGHKSAPVRTDVIGADILDVIDVGMTLGNLVETVADLHQEHPLRVRGVVFHLLWARLLHVDLNVPLSSSSFVAAESIGLGHVC